MMDLAFFFNRFFFLFFCFTRIPSPSTVFILIPFIPSPWPLRVFLALSFPSSMMNDAMYIEKEMASAFCLFLAVSFSLLVDARRYCCWLLACDRKCLSTWGLNKVDYRFHPSNLHSTPKKAYVNPEENEQAIISLSHNIQIKSSRLPAQPLFLSDSSETRVRVLHWP